MQFRQRTVRAVPRRRPLARKGQPRRGSRPLLRTSREQARRLNEEELKRLTKNELDLLARHEQLPLRSKMNKAQLARTLRRHYRQLPR